MTTTPRIILNNVCFHLNQSPIRFNAINLSFESYTYGIVGRNGAGKTTLLQLILDEYKPDSGNILRSGKLLHVAQSHNNCDNTTTVSDALGVSTLLQALDRVNRGEVNQHDFDALSDNWDIEGRIKLALEAFQLSSLDLQSPFNQLSGGQKTKLHLAKTLIFPADFLLFDEPSNNLDSQSKQVLQQYIQQAKQGVIIISHDRTLLNQCDRIIEITPTSAQCYGGNYDFYKQQKETHRLAAEHALQACNEQLKQSKKLIQTRMERHQKNESYGKKEKLKQIASKGRYDKIEINSKKGRSQNTNRRIRLQADKKLTQGIQLLEDSRQQLEVYEPLNINLESTAVPKQKTVLEIKDLYFAYDNKIKLINNFNLKIIGPHRVAITGPNGCGKSTLIQLIRGAIAPSAGHIHLGLPQPAIAYLDQAVSFLKPELSLVDNFQLLNPGSKPFDAYHALAAFKFRNKEAEKQVGCLSGGERMRAGLAICLLSTPAPQLIILDEPTNHLDLDAIEAIEQALKLYQGAIIAVSHDDSFLYNIDIQQRISLQATKGG